MREAAANLTPVTLELGGKSPTLISEDVPMDLAAERICFGKALNAGQTCVAPDYVLCPHARIDEFVDAFGAVLGRMYPGLVRNSDYSAVVNERHFRRIKGYLEDARSKGAQVVELNPGGLSPEPGSRKLPLYLVKNATPRCGSCRRKCSGRCCRWSPTGTCRRRSTSSMPARARWR
jgi:coniferyl-aldehyde dehydrogenase